MNGAPYDCGVYASSLRRDLFGEHLGQPQGLDDDPVCEYFYRDVWQSTSKQNTQLFEEVILINMIWNYWRLWIKPEGIIKHIH